MFYIAKPFGVLHRPGPFRKKTVMRLTCTLALTCLFAACVPPKAVEVPEDPAAKPKTNKPAPARDVPAEPLRLVQGNSGMITPELEKRLPDQRDMRPTTEPVKQDGPTVRAKAPGASE